MRRVVYFVVAQASRVVEVGESGNSSDTNARFGVCDSKPDMQTNDGNADRNYRARVKARDGAGDDSSRNVQRCKSIVHSSNVQEIDASRCRTCNAVAVARDADRVGGGRGMIMRERAVKAS